MTTAVMIVALFVSQPPCVLPPSVRQIDKLRPLSIETPLVEGGNEVEGDDHPLVALGRRGNRN